MNNETKYYLLRGEENEVIAVIASGDDFSVRLAEAISDQYCGDKVVGGIHINLELLHKRVGYSIPFSVNMVETIDTDFSSNEYDSVRDFIIEQVILY